MPLAFIILFTSLGTSQVPLRKGSELIVEEVEQLGSAGLGEDQGQAQQP